MNVSETNSQPHAVETTDLHRLIGTNPSVVT